MLKKHVSEWISLGFQLTISMCPLWDCSQEVVSKYGEIGDGAGGPWWEDLDYQTLYNAQCQQFR